MRRTLLVGLGLIGSMTTGCSKQDRLFDPSSVESPADEETIESHEVCVGSSVVSAGALADTLYYRAVMRADGKLVVGYYAFWSEERPWGNNWMTWTLLPALAIDMVYSHGFIVGPGYQRFAYGKEDVEGFRIEYTREPDGQLRVEKAVANNALHQTVSLTSDEVMAIDGTRPTLYSDVWSHQLGGKGIKSKNDLAQLRCFGPGKIKPLTKQLADSYALGRRARPAHVESLGTLIGSSKR